MPHAHSLESLVNTTHPNSSEQEIRSSVLRILERFSTPFKKEVIMTNLAQHRGWSWGIRLRAAKASLVLLVILGLAVVATQRAEAQRTFTVLYSFTGNSDGGNPAAGLIRDAAGNFYGTTEGGGAFDQGTVFKLDTTGAETVLYSFTGSPDGSSPAAGLIRDTAGNLYGTTQAGGSRNLGTVFELDTTGAETVLHSFTTDTDGAMPEAGLIRDAPGNLYGTTSMGGPLASGTVFKLDATGTETILYSFSGLNGQFPSARLIRDAAGDFYSTTGFGGSFGWGTVFKLDATGAETVLYSFTGGTDGFLPTGGLFRDADGNLYGTTSGGGTFGVGNVFKLDTLGAETVLYSFIGTPDGEGPAGWVRDAAGNLYGITYRGGAFGKGTVFKVNATGAETVLHSFRGGDGEEPAALFRDADGNLYGTTFLGGAFRRGTVFMLSR